MNRIVNPALTTLVVAVSCTAIWPAASVQAQVAGATTTLEARVTESTQYAMGWSVKRSLMDKTLYNEAGQPVGKVDDLIISPDRSVSYVIVRAGGFIGIGSHDVAISVSQIREASGRLVMDGATKDTIAAMPAFEYASEPGRRDQFVAAADQDIAEGRAKLAELETLVGTAATDARALIDRQRATVQGDVTAAEARLGEMKQAGVARWKEFEAEVSAATARLRKSIETPAS
jgi:sporulation protein YlmC with PRC-barrel domain